MNQSECGWWSRRKGGACQLPGLEADLHAESEQHERLEPLELLEPLL